MLIVQELLGYALLGLIGLLLAGVCYLPIYFLLRKRIPLSRQIPYFLFGVCVLVISTPTFLADVMARILGGEGLFAAYHSLNLVPFRFLTESWAMGERKQFTQALANIFMFMPLGFSYPLAFLRMRRFWKTTASMLAFSFLIEFIQYFIGRSADVDDLILNTIGGMFGYAIFVMGVRIVQKIKRRRRCDFGQEP